MTTYYATVLELSKAKSYGLRIFSHNWIKMVFKCSALFILKMCCC
jgi:hypothetical protein